MGYTWPARMASPVLLVHDDIATIASVRRLLAREGYEVILATSAADALIAFGHYLPGLLVLAPSVEGGRGQVVMEELALHPDRALARVLLLGESIPGFSTAVVPLPLDGGLFLETVKSLMRDTATGEWTVVDHRRPTLEVPAVQPAVPEAWRATAPPDVSGEAPAEEPGGLDEADWALAAMTPRERKAHQEATERARVSERAAMAALEQAHREIEQEAVRSLENTLYPPEEYEDPQEQEATGTIRFDPWQVADDELEREVLEAAHERRRTREETKATRAEVAKEIGGLEPELDFGELVPARDPEADLRRLQLQMEEEALREAEALALAEMERAEQEALALEQAELERAQKEAEAQAEIERLQQEAEAQARLEAEAQAQAEIERLQQEAEEQARLEAETQARLEAEALAQQEAEEQARLEAEEQARLEAEEQARLEAEEQARLEAEAQVRLEAEAQARQEAEEQARLEAEEQARLEAEALAQAEIERARQQAEALAEGLREALESREAETARLRAEIEQRDAQARALASKLALEEQERARREAQLLADLEQESLRRQESEQRLASLEAELVAREAALDEARAREAALAERERSTRERAAAEELRAREVAEETARQSGALREQSEQTLAALRHDLERSDELARLERQERDALAARLAELEAESARARARADEAQASALEEHRLLLEEQSARLEAEQEAQRAREEAEELARLAQRPVELPGPKPLRLARAGTVDVEALARLVMEVSRAGAELRLDLKVEDAVRTLWFQRGRVVGALSSLAHESLLDRARADGLIDARQDAELRLLRGMAPAELVQHLRARGYLREHEVVPLLQRHSEHVALEALSEASCEYRLTEEPPLPGAAPASPPRSTLEIVFEALRRALDGEARLAALGGLRATPAPVEAGKALLAGLHLPERERRMLSQVDGESSVEALLLASGLRQRSALTLLSACAALRIIELLPAPAEPAAPTAELEVERLEAKFREVQDADYFAILGVPRSAGGDEIQRALQRLASQYDPLRFVGHEDPSLQHRAHQVQEALAEAAHVLADERLRQSYARSLLG
jgi:hypothetical protein